VLCSSYRQRNCLTQQRNMVIFRC